MSTTGIQLRYEGGQTEVVWRCHAERPGVCRKKDDRNGVTGKEEKRPKKRFLDVVKEDMGKLVRGRRTWKIGPCGRTLYDVATPD